MKKLSVSLLLPCTAMRTLQTLLLWGGCICTTFSYAYTAQAQSVTSNSTTTATVNNSTTATVNNNTVPPLQTKGVTFTAPTEQIDSTIFAEEAENYFAVSTPLYQALLQNNTSGSPKDHAELILLTMKNLDNNWQPIITQLVAEGFNEAELLILFSRLGNKAYSPAYMAAKVTELHGIYGVGLPKNEEDEAIIPEGYEQPLSTITAGECRTFLQTYDAALKDIQKNHGVPANIILGILLIETGLGTNLGDDSALRALASMAATTTPEMLAKAGNTNQIKRIAPAALKNTLQNKSSWAYNELKALITYAKINQLDTPTLPGSMYGAIGLCQFMPSNIQPYALDGDKNGKVDLFSVIDAMYSVANYLESHGWRSAKTKEQQFAVIRQYNHDNIYAARVLGVANQIALAQKGKLASGSNPLGGAYGIPGGYLDPSLRRGKRFVPASAKIKSLNSYQDILGTD